MQELVPLAQELVRARTKFPDNQYMLTALAEEIGEMAEAWMENPDSSMTRKEALQVACVAMRIVTEPARTDGECLKVVKAMKALEPLSRKFWDSLKDRPDLSARSPHITEDDQPGEPRNWEFETLEDFVKGNYWHNPEDAIGDIRLFITKKPTKITTLKVKVAEGCPPQEMTALLQHINEGLTDPDYHIVVNYPVQIEVVAGEDPRKIEVQKRLDNLVTALGDSEQCIRENGTHGLVTFDNLRRIAADVDLSVKELS
jgi:NTP pyrophosphatase (non-canonical NTP hydrolase)